MNKNNRKDDAFQANVYCVGPLNLDRHAKQATTATGAALDLSENGFDALDFLAVREDRALMFEQLYNGVWETENSRDRRAEARLEIEEMAARVNEAGNGFMRIDREPDGGYVFRTNWGQNRRDRVMARARASPAPHAPRPAKPRKRRRIAAIACVACLSAAVITAAVFSGRDGGQIFFEDEQVPLAAPDFLTEPRVEYPDVEYPDIGEIIVAADASEAEVDWRNPESNTHLLTFEIVLTETGETLYVSEKVEPGGRIVTAALTKTLPPGEHRATLIIRAYEPGRMGEQDARRPTSPGGQTETGDKSEEIQLIIGE